MTRKDALDLLKMHVTTDRVFRHSLAVEAAMIAYAKHFGEDPVRWGLLGLLHDIDFEKYPEIHPAKAPELLKDSGMDQSFIDSILSHGTDSPVPRDTRERKCLHAVDEMASFIIAVALMRPDRFEGLAAKSVKKKMKDKPFARAVDREELISSMEELGMEFNEHIAIIVDGLRVHNELIEKEGYQLL
ncbi:MULTISPECIES: HD domain-containing protein [unclassified Fusibacter]|uniref:HD domain-containing protein n=1 Tax=unclassified Fusibacter TaxID=2624464 RepID=UPI001013571E|nr:MULTISPECIES: HD domain-containing protein [unclassified Fusibacter]MCK8060922.1 HD domain-containing protein [Fusibacter sp. A2]NPE23218.1 HD domain-containing protein [Fusibacter sp. A1]RXV59574.1 HD domain-containing protein [Fusibacter sp. A1]